MTELRNNNPKLLKELGSLGATLLRLMPPEKAHNFAGKMLQKGLIPFKVRTHNADSNLDFSCKLPPLQSLDHPIGLAAGFDKNAQYLSGLKKLGFSFIEVGAATPLPQSGNEKPRIFRLKEKEALINRMGFNNIGIEKINAELLKFSSKHIENTPLIALNIGVNKKTPQEKALRDYILVLQKATANLSYYSINLSSPNTATLKSLCNPQSIKTLADGITNETDKSLDKIWIKLGPNLPKDFFTSIVDSVCEFGFGGLILTNTYPVSLPHQGGLSGKPLKNDSTKALEWAWEVHKGSMPMIAVGGVNSGRDAFEKIRRGADLVQIYTAFIYRGPYIVEEILEELAEVMKMENIKSLKELKGSYYH